MLLQKTKLVEGIIQGDKKSFETLFIDLFPRLYHFSFDFVKDKEIAKDIVHESFIRLWESKAGLKPDSNLEAFLITVCRNRCLNFLKHKKVILSYHERLTAEITEIEILSGILEDNSFGSIDYDILKAKITQAINSLPDQCRRVFEMSRFHKKKYSDIASILSISLKTVEAHMSLALKRLKVELKEFL